VEYLPGDSLQSEEQLHEAAARIGTTIFHPVGTCRMGNDADAVVDAQLRVHGVPGLRIADASIMPRITSGNTCSPTLMIAEKAAQLILNPPSGPAHHPRTGPDPVGAAAGCDLCLFLQDQKIAACGSSYRTVPFKAARNTSGTTKTITVRDTDMSEHAQPLDAASGSTSNATQKVIFASSLGTVFEWYDFFLYGALAAVISKQFFAGVNDTTAFIFALMAFAAGFIVRPFGALVFGRLGDMIGRKYTFLATIVLMGLATFCVGLLPNYASIGIAAPIILVVLRMLQGLALGGEYGGAATYVAEHAPIGKRGFHTSWIQSTATLGLLLSLLVVLVAVTSPATSSKSGAGAFRSCCRSCCWAFPPGSA
jgi:hypothetical protein